MTAQWGEHDHPSSPAPASGARPMPSASQLAWDPFGQRYVAQAPARMNRRELTSACPFCADLTSGAVAPGTQAWIRPNDFPALTPPAGECYILIYSADHDRTFAELGVAEVVRVVGLWRRIYQDLAPRYPCVVSWETSGPEIGQTQRHPHGQSYGTSFVPPQLATELALAVQAEAIGACCPFCAERYAERAGPRTVLTGAAWSAFVPAYARYPYQVRLTPAAHVPHIAALAAGEAEVELARDLLWLVRAYDRVFGAPMPYMLALHQLADPRFHLHIELLPVGRAPGKLKLPAGIELAFGLWVNDSLPVARAAALRDALGEEPR